MREGIRAAIFGGAGAAGEPLMLGLEHLGTPVPPWVNFGVVAACAALILLAVATASHMAAVWMSKRGRRKLGQALIVTVGMIFVIIGTSAVAYAFLRFGPEKFAENPPTNNGAVVAPGKGGDAVVEGKRSGAIGGDAGDSGLWPGGPGGNALVRGDRSYARGGSGSNSPQPDGRGGRRTKSPGELENLPTAMWPYGYGGHGANTLNMTGD